MRRFRRARRDDDRAFDRCPFCGAPAPVDERACPRCGRELTQERLDLLDALGPWMSDAARAEMIAIFRGDRPLQRKAAPEPGAGVRKQVYELTAADLERAAVWEFALDEEGEPGQDEAPIKPRAELEAVESADGLFVVRAAFRAASGARFVGYVSPGDEIRDVQPAIVADRGRVAFWSGISPPSAERIDTAYASLGETASSLFPLRYRSALPVDGSPLQGEVAGFSWYDDAFGIVVRR